MIDPAGFSSQLVAATRGGLDSNIAAQSSKVSAKIREFTALDKNVASLSTTLKDLIKTNNLSATETKLSKDDIIKATTTEGALVGDYSVEVSQLAKPDRWGMSFTDENWKAPKDGQLKLDVGSDSMSLDLSTLPADANLLDLRDAINNASDNPGIQASIIRSGTSVELVFSAEKSGAANTIAMTLSGGSSAEYAELDSAITAKTQLSVAQDAMLKFNGVDITSPTNKIENITDNVTLELTSTNVGSPITLTVSRDDSAITGSLEKLVSAYNILKGRVTLSTISSSGSDSSASRPALSGDSSVSGMMRALRATFSNFPDGNSLSQMGLKFNRDGDLSIDKEALEKSLDQDPQILNKLLLGDTGVISNLSKVLEPYSKTSGIFDMRIQSLNSETKRLEDKTAQIDLQMDNLYKRYLQQFTALNSMQAQMEQTTSLFA
jgi:flagellar hook-associated protein 2